jgi:hypothetical protein
MTIITIKDRTYTVINPEDKDYTDHLWAVSFASYLGYSEVVYANHAEDAIDTYADYAQEQGWLGLFLDQDDIDYEDADVIFVGNYGLPIGAHEVFIQQLS